MVDNKDIFNLMFRLRGGLARDMYGMQHEGLFSRSRVGTKLLVEEYHRTVVTALDTICDSNPDIDDVRIDLILIACKFIDSFIDSSNLIVIILLFRFHKMQN